MARNRMYIGDEMIATDEADVLEDMALALSGDEGEDDLDVFAGDEIIGLEEIIGAHLAAKRATAKSSTSRKLRALKAAALAKAAGGVMLRKQTHTRPVKDQILPVGPQAYLASATADVVLIPQRTFRPNRLVFSSLITPFFTMNSLLVGQDPQFVAGGSVPLEVLSQVGVGVGITGTTANLGNTITIGLTNLDAVNPQTVRGAIFGTTVY
jgi:hypothetical protein